MADRSPSQLSTAIVDVLRVSGAGLVMMQEPVRWPVGASDVNARPAEQIQATLTEGPCLASARRRQILANDESDLERDWPI